MTTLTAIGGLLAVLLAVLPGVPGDLSYRALAGVSWKEKELQQLLRLLAFSALGLALYTLSAPSMGFPIPEYVLPGTFAAGVFRAEILPRIAFEYIGHFLGATLVGTVAAAVVIGLRKFSRSFGQRDAWDQLIHQAVAKRWVVVRLRTGESYAGFIDHADVAVEPNCRDMILAEPYLWDESTRTYQPTWNQWLFLQGSEVSSLAVVHDPGRDDRVVPPRETPFLLGDSDGKRTEALNTVDEGHQGGREAPCTAIEASRSTADAPTGPKAQ